MGQSKSIFDSRYKKLVVFLTKLRMDSGLSQKKFSKLSGLQPTFIARTELRERRLDLIEAIDYMKALGMSKEEIIKKIKELI